MTALVLGIAGLIGCSKYRPHNPRSLADTQNSTLYWAIIAGIGIGVLLGVDP